MGAKRKLSEVDIYHVVSRGTGRQLIFECDEDRETFLRLLKRTLKLTNVELYAWCLMGNHYHLLVHASLDRISAMMRLLNSSYARWFNYKGKRVGHLFQCRFKSEPVNDEAYLMTVIRYIHRNPDVAGIANTESYRWSSFKEYIGTGGLCLTDFPLSLFGSIDAFAAFHKDWNNDAGCLDVDALRNATRPMSDEDAIEYAQSAVGGIRLAEIKTLEVEERNACLRRLRQAGLSIRQIERLTGIGRGTVAKVSSS